MSPPKSPKKHSEGVNIDQESEVKHKTRVHYSLHRGTPSFILKYLFALDNQMQLKEEATGQSLFFVPP